MAKQKYRYMVEVSWTDVPFEQQKRTLDLVANNYIHAKQVAKAMLNLKGSAMNIRFIGEPVKCDMSLFDNPKPNRRSNKDKYKYGRDFKTGIIPVKKKKLDPVGQFHYGDNY